MTVRQGQTEIVVPYAHITTVRLCRSTHAIFRMVISFGKQSIIVTNQFVKDKETESRSRQYATFVRVLHFHLKDKSTAVYQSGCSRGKIWLTGITLTVGSFMVSFVTDFLGFGIINPYADGTVLAVIAVPLILVLQIVRLPKDYSATNIPFELLPAA